MSRQLIGWHDRQHTLECLVLDSFPHSLLCIYHFCDLQVMCRSDKGAATESLMSILVKREAHNESLKLAFRASGASCTGE